MATHSIFARNNSQRKFKFIQGLLALIFVISLLGVPPTVAKAATVNLEASADTWLRQSYTTRNYGGSPTIQASPNSSSRQNSLYLWDLSGIPTSATVTSASLTFNVTDSSAYDFSLYRMRRTWVEGTSNDAVSTTSANWNTYNGTTNWGSGGAMNTSSDRYDTDLWDATASTFGTTGSVTIALNSNGVAAVQAWITTPASNYGLTVQYMGSGTTADYWIVDSSEATTVANRPKLNVTYNVPPTIITSGTLTAFSTQPGVPSVAQTYTVSGSYLTGNILITAPTGFQLSTDGSTYSSTLTLTQSGGSVSVTTIYVRLYSTTEGAFSGNITHTSTGATTQNVAASGNVSNCFAVNLNAAEDTYLSANDVTYNNGGNTVIHVDATTGTSRRTALLKWDLSAIPTSATVSAAGITLNVTDASPLVFNLYNMRRTWVEGTSSQAASSTSTNWNTYDGVNSWGTVGAANTSSDRYDTNLWGATTTSFSTTGSKTVALNTDGQAVVQGWIAGSTSNYGLIMQNYSGSTSNALYFSSSEAATAADRPKLNITYCLPTGPTINTSGTLTAFSTQPGVPSTAQTYSVSGVYLTDNILITAPTGFQLSTDGSAYSSSLTLTQSGGSVSATTIYVRLYSASEGAFSGNITHTSAGATQLDLPATGNVSNCFTVNLNAAEDTYLSANDVTYNNGGNVEIHVNATTGTDRRTALLKWDLSSIPSSATVSSAGLSLNVIDTSTVAYNLYNLRRTWVEGTSSQAASSTSANWNTYDGTNSWGTVGAASTSADRYDTNLWNATTSSFSTAGSTTVALNANGVAVVQGWIAGSTSNYGLIIQTYSGTTNTFYFSSSEAATAANWPKLNLSYCVPTGPTINTGGTLTAFSTQPGIVSPAQTYAVSGSNLTENIVINAPTGFELSTDGVTYGSSLALTQSAGLVPLTTIYVRLYSETEGAFSGNITHTSAGATTRNVAASGAVSYTFTVTFQYGASGYTGTIDTFIRGTTEGTTNFSSDPGLEWDDNTGTTTDEIALIRFGGIFSTEGGPIPLGASITSASLTYMTTDLNSGSTANGDPANVYESLVDWPGTTVTYNNFGGEAGVQTDEYNSSLIDSAPAGALSTAYTIDVTSSLQRWSDGTANYGWIFLPTAADGVTIYSSDFATVSYHPLLSVTYNTGSLPQYNLTVSNDGHGTVTLNPPGGSYVRNTVVRLTPVPNSGYQFATWGGTNAADPSDNGDGTWSLIMNGNKTLTANFTYSPVNLAPNQPALIQPLDNATNVATSPTLVVTASDPNPADTLTVSFYGRPAGAAAGADFTLAVLPDMQNESQYAPAMVNSQMNWIVAQQSARNIVFVTSVGDLVNTPSDTAQYNNADAGYDILDTAGIPYSVGPGNHDMMGGTLYNTYFGISRFSGKSWYGGYYGSDNYNNYSLFSASGNDFLLINLQYSPSAAILNWADALMKANSSRRVIVEQHDILNIDNSWNNMASYTALKDNPNLFLMLCGHMHSSGDGAAYRAELGDDGHTIHIVMADYQDMSYGNGWLRLLRFSPADDMIYMTTYSPYTGGSFTTDPDQKNLVYDLTNGSSPAYTLINTVTGVANGAYASTSWPGLLAFTKYEWYATVSDGTVTTNGPTESFTTGNSPTAVMVASFTAQPQAPGIQLTWQTLTEIDLLSFNLYRSETADGPLVRLNPEQIQAKIPGSSTGAEYTYLDDPPLGKTYYYWLEGITISDIWMESPLLAGNYPIFMPVLAK